MKKYFEVRWHGRGGQGAKTAALLFGEAAMETGKYIQAFPEYGPERTGAPMQSFNRLSDEPIRLHSGVKNPNVVIVLDPSLLDVTDVTQGLVEGGYLIVNTQEPPEKIKEKVKRDDIKVAVVDATGIAMKHIGKNVPNTPLLGAMVKVTQVLDFEKMLEVIEKKFSIKFRGREEIVKGNIESIKKAYEEVKVA